MKDWKMHNSFFTLMTTTRLTVSVACTTGVEEDLRRGRMGGSEGRRGGGGGI